MNFLSNGNSHGEAHRAIGSTERGVALPCKARSHRPKYCLKQSLPTFTSGPPATASYPGSPSKISRERCGPRSGYAQRTVGATTSMIVPHSKHFAGLIIEDSGGQRCGRG